jgi:hypothetical protein
VWTLTVHIYSYGTKKAGISFNEDRREASSANAADSMQPNSKRMDVSRPGAVSRQSISARQCFHLAENRERPAAPPDSRLVNKIIAQTDVPVWSKPLWSLWPPGIKPAMNAEARSARLLSISTTISPPKSVSADPGNEFSCKHAGTRSCDKAVRDVQASCYH